jgi:hypothetical protein
MKGWSVILYILAFLTFVAVIYTIERRDSQISVKNKEDIITLQNELKKLQKDLDAANKVSISLTERLTSTEQALGTMAEKFNAAEDKIKTIEMIAHSAKMDAMRKPQKIAIDMPAIRLVQSCAKKKPKKATSQKPDAKVIQDVKRKLKELSQ